MKNKYKILSLIIVFIGISLSLWNCQKEYELSYNQEDNQTNGFLFKAKVGSFKNFENIKPFNEAIQNYKNSFLTKNSENEFTIDSTTILELSKENYVSYTMKINRDNGSDYFVENLLIEIDSTNNYKTSIVAYSPTQEWIDNYNNGIEQEFQGGFTITPIDYDVNFSNTSRTMDCIYVFVETTHHCNGVAHDYAEFADQICAACGRLGSSSDTWVTSELVAQSCWNSGASGGYYSGQTGTESSETNNTNGGSSAGSQGNNDSSQQNNNNFAATGLIPPDPCHAIASQINNAEFQNKVEDIQENINTNQEKGFAQTTDGEYTELTSVNNGHGLSFPDPLPNNIYGYIHCHTNNYEIPNDDDPDNPNTVKTIKIFSPRDIKIFLKLVLNAQENNIPTNNVYASVYSSAGDYTLRFTGEVSNINISNIDWAAEKTFFEELFQDGSKQFWSRERKFLYYLKQRIGIDGISLFKIKNNGNIVNYKLKENNSLEKQPCIN